MKEDKKEKHTRENLVAGLSTSEVVDRYGSANAEHIIAYNGVNNETGQVLQKGLKEISNHKVNEQFEQNNLRQQAGFAAEIKKTSRTNAENIINKSDERIARTADISVNGEKLGNHKKFDHARVDKNGNPVLDKNGNLTGGSQQKVHYNIKKYDKYSKPDLYEQYKDATFDVPSDQYEDIQKSYSKQISKLEEQEQRLRADGKNDLADQKRAEIERRKDLKKRFRDSGVSTVEAMEARKDPLLSTIKDMGKISHRAGIEAAKGAMVISGSISIVQNSIAFVKGDKELQNALTDIAKTTAKSAGIAYTSSFTGAFIKSGMQQSKSVYMRGLSKTSLPALVVTTCLETGKCIKSYIKGEIDEVELLEDLGKTGTGIAASSLGVTLGQIAIPIPIAGAIIGGMIGYTLNSFFYAEALNAFKGAKESEENYYRIKAICEVARLQLNEYEKQIREEFQAQFSESVCFYDNIFKALNSSIMSGNISEFEKSIKLFSDRLGKELQYETFSEFDDAMNSEEKILI